MEASTSSTSGSAEHLPAGRVVASRYRVESVLGEGASGVVYVAKREPEGDRVALKVIHKNLCNDPHFSRRFTREASILKQLEGNHIVRLLDIVEDDGMPVLVLEYVEGLSLEALLKERTPSIEEAVEISLQICAALGAAHAGGFVHRDLKPGNVLVQGELGTARTPMVWVVDFGLGKALHQERGTTNTSLTERDMILGTPEYMSPEQVRGDDVDRPADIYAAGVILFEMLTGRVPYQGKTPITSMTAHLSEPIPSPRAVRPDRGIPAALEAVVVRALAKDPADRYGSARELAQALSAAREAHHVIAVRAVEDADALATGDTELELRDAAAKAKPLAFAATVNASPVPEAVVEKNDSRKGGGLPIVWIALAILLAIGAIAIGFTIGAR